MQTAQKTCLLDDLQGVLEEQIKLLRKSDIGGVERLAIKAGLIVNQIAGSKQLDRQQFEAKRKNLVKLYERLELMVEAGKDSTEKQMQKIDQGIKTVEKYRINV